MFVLKKPFFSSAPEVPLDFFIRCLQTQGSSGFLRKVSDFFTQIINLSCAQTWFIIILPEWSSHGVVFLCTLCLFPTPTPFPRE